MFMPTFSSIGSASVFLESLLRAAVRWNMPVAAFMAWLGFSKNT